MGDNGVGQFSLENPVGFDGTQHLLGNHPARGASHGVACLEGTWVVRPRTWALILVSCASQWLRLPRQTVTLNREQKSMELLSVLVFVAVGVVLLFDYTNGFHNPANIIATPIASRALTPIQAVKVRCHLSSFSASFWAAPRWPIPSANPSTWTTSQLFSRSPSSCVASSGAIFWNLTTVVVYGIPSSSSHALVGGLAGAVIVAVGADHVIWGSRSSPGTRHRRYQGAAGADHLPAYRLLGRVLHPSAGVFPDAWGPSRASISFSSGFSWSPAPAWPSPTGPTTPRRAWGSSPPGAPERWLPHGVSRAFLGHSLLRRSHHPGHPLRRLAHCAHRRLRHLQGPPHPCIRRLRGDLLLSVITTASLIEALSPPPVGQLRIDGYRRSGAAQGRALGKTQDIVSTWVTTIPGAGTVSVLTYLLVINALLGVN